MATGKAVTFLALLAAFIGTVFFLYPGNNDALAPLNAATVNVMGIPIIGLGTWLSEKSKVSLSGNVFVSHNADAEHDKVTDAVTVALDAGYRHIDAAAIYGMPFPDPAYSFSEVLNTIRKRKASRQSSQTCEYISLRPLGDLQIVE